jgi:hypothetical protein
VGSLTDEHFVRALEDLILFAHLIFLLTTAQMLGHVILVKVKTSENHIRQLKVFNFISLLKRDILELLLIIQIGENIVSYITLDVFGSLFFDFITLLFWDLGCLSPISRSKSFKVILIDTVDSKSVIRVNFTCIPYLLLITFHRFKEKTNPLSNIIVNQIIMIFH